MIVIVNYGMGNLRSVLKCFERMKVESLVSDKESEILKADKLILPGVGHFGQAMKNLTDKALLGPLQAKVLREHTPILGICLGMQLFSRWSEEGDAKGLGWIDADVVRFDLKRMDTLRKIPHMGWNTLNFRKKCPITCDIEENDSFYFVHSFIVKCVNKDDIVATSQYGHEFTSVLQQGNIFGMQFHPEKSQSKGMNILSRFAKLNGKGVNKNV